MGEQERDVPVTEVVPGEGWGVLHLFFHLQRGVLQDPAAAAFDFVERVAAFDGREGYQALTFAVLGQKADLGLMLLGPDLAVLDGLAVDLAASPLGAVLTPAGSYLSLTERSEYTSTEADEAQRLVAAGVAEDSPGHAAALEEFRGRMAAYAEHRLHPRLPAHRVIGFYPMAKRREPEQNWYALPFAERKRLMLGHAEVGKRHRGRILQLITGSTGLDDWEWGVTLLADDIAALRDVVYDMRFDEVSARYSEFGPFLTGMVLTPGDLVRHLALI